jgi:hypothetical protein
MIEHPIRLSCGHGVDDFDEGYPAVTKDWTHDQYGSHRVLRHSTVCRPCLDRYHQHGLLFESEEQGVDWVTEDDIVVRLQKRAEIRRSIPHRKSVVEGKPDRIAELLEEAAAAIIRLRGY